MENNIQKQKSAKTRKIYELLDGIRKHPEQWLTSRSMTALQNFLNGYLSAATPEEMYSAGDPSLNDFKYWVLNKDERELGVNNPYSNVILHQCNNDEEQAFEKFFEYLGEFQREKQNR